MNLFVAGFIGSPAMNLVQARIDRSGDDVFAAFADVRLRVDEEAIAVRPALAGYDGREVVVGIRPDAPEDAALARDAPADLRFTCFAPRVGTAVHDAHAHAGALLVLASKQ